MAVFERLLARLLVVAPNRWVLKGALALDFRLGARSRSTKDMDLVRLDSADAATADMLAVQTCDLGDHFAFAVHRTDRLDALTEGSAVRHHLRAQLAGRIFEETTVDIGLADPLGWSPDPIICPDLLSFAGITPIYVSVLPLAQYVAEKLHAYTRGYSGGAILSTRVKDLADLVLIAEFASFDAVHLREALIGVFAGRGRQSLPAAIPLPPDTWLAPHRILAEPVGIDPDVLQGHAHAAAFLDPVLAVPFEGRWDHLAQRWVAPGAGAQRCILAPRPAREGCRMLPTICTSGPGAAFEYLPQPVGCGYVPPLCRALPTSRTTHRGTAGAGPPRSPVEERAW